MWDSIENSNITPKIRRIELLHASLVASNFTLLHFDRCRSYVFGQNFKYAGSFRRQRYTGFPWLISPAKPVGRVGSQQADTPAAALELRWHWNGAKNLKYEPGDLPAQVLHVHALGSKAWRYLHYMQVYLAEEVPSLEYISMTYRWKALKCIKTVKTSAWTIWMHLNSYFWTRSRTLFTSDINSLAIWNITQSSSSICYRYQS